VPTRWDAVPVKAIAATKKLAAKDLFPHMVDEAGWNLIRARPHVKRLHWAIIEAVL
jgi:hypothetical protein